MPKDTKIAIISAKGVRPNQRIYCKFNVCVKCLALSEAIWAVIWPAAAGAERERGDREGTTRLALFTQLTLCDGAAKGASSTSSSGDQRPAEQATSLISTKNRQTTFCCCCCCCKWMSGQCDTHFLLKLQQQQQVHAGRQAGSQAVRQAARRRPKLKVGH